MRMIIVALVTTDVHARDIIDELCDRKVSDVHNFSWQQQLRYYWELESDDCWIRHSDARVHYGYEYMGATSRLVITPLTDRCWLTLTGSYALNLGGAPAGPAGESTHSSNENPPTELMRMSLQLPSGTPLPPTQVMRILPLN